MPERTAKAGGHPTNLPVITESMLAHVDFASLPSPDILSRSLRSLANPGSSLTQARETVEDSLLPTVLSLVRGERMPNYPRGVAEVMTALRDPESDISTTIADATITRVQSAIGNQIERLRASGDRHDGAITGLIQLRLMLSNQLHNPNQLQRHEVLNGISNAGIGASEVTYAMDLVSYARRGEHFDEIIQPTEDLPKFISMLAVFAGTTEAWDVSAAKAVQRRLEYNGPSQNLRHNIERLAVEYPSLDTISEQNFLDLSFDRWASLRQVLIERQVFPEDTIREFDQALTNKLTQIMFAHGPQDESAVRASLYRLRQLHAVDALPELIRFQLETSEPSGLYATSHVNADVMYLIGEFLTEIPTERLLEVTHGNEFYANLLRGAKRALGQVSESSEVYLYSATDQLSTFVGTHWNELLDQLERSNLPEDQQRAWRLSMLHMLGNYDDLLADQYTLGQDFYTRLTQTFDIHDPEEQAAVMYFLGRRIHPVRPLGNITTYPDFVPALTTMLTLVQNTSFQPTLENVTGFAHAITYLQFNEQTPLAEQATFALQLGQMLSTEQQRRIPTQGQYDQAREIFPQYLTQVRALLERTDLPVESRFVLLQLAEEFPSVGYDRIVQDITSLLGFRNRERLEEVKLYRDIIGNTSPAFLFDTAGELSRRFSPESCLLDILVDRLVRYNDQTAADTILDAYIRNMRTARARGHVSNQVQRLLVNNEGHFISRATNNPNDRLVLQQRLWARVGTRMLDSQTQPESADILGELLTRRVIFEHDRFAAKVLTDALARTQRTDVLTPIFSQTQTLLRNFERQYELNPDTDDGAFAQELFEQTLPIIARRMPDLQDPLQQLMGFYVMSIASDRLASYGIQLSDFQAIWDNLIEQKLGSQYPWSTRIFLEINERLPQLSNH